MHGKFYSGQSSLFVNRILKTNVGTLKLLWTYLLFRMLHVSKKLQNNEFVVVRYENLEALEGYF